MNPEPARIPIDAQKQTLIERCNQEQRLATTPFFRIPLDLDLTAALAIVGNLQLALRHQGNAGPSAEIARTAVDSIIRMMREAGLTAHAELVRLGDDPAWDDARGTGR